MSIVTDTCDFSLALLQKNLGPKSALDSSVCATNHISRHPNSYNVSSYPSSSHHPSAPLPSRYRLPRTQIWERMLHVGEQSYGLPVWVEDVSGRRSEYHSNASPSHNNRYAGWHRLT